MRKIDFDKKNNKPLYAKTSKGNQPKWFMRGKWYKADSFGYESLSEIVVSRLLAGQGVDAVSYESTWIVHNDRIKPGCFSKDFKRKDEELITIEKLGLVYNGKALSSQLATIPSTKDKIKYTVDMIETVCEIKNAGEALTRLLEIDAFFLNEDRHTNNIALLYNNDEASWRFAPIYDNGLSLLSDTRSYPINEHISSLKKQVKAKPFSRKFDSQVKAAESLYGVQWQAKFSEQDVDEALVDLAEYYDEKTLVRVRNIIRSQR